jgi:2-polyprenyl-6-methoxyphenol hydroxylase-like FAD-dependent oxidoreductase
MVLEGDRNRDDVADVVIVGGGLSGCATAMALADGRRKIVILEARKGKNPRFNGELIHPTGVDVLDQLGFLPALTSSGAAQIVGFACMPSAEARRRSGQKETLLPYREIEGSRPYGLGIDHRDLVEVLRDGVWKRLRIEVRTGARVTNVVREAERVVGVQTTEGVVRAPLVVACDGRHSKLRTLVGIDERARLISYTAAALLRDCPLPHPGHGHIFLGAWGPILAYPIAAPNDDGTETARACIDLPLEMERGTDAVIAAIRESYLPHVDAGVAESLRRALDAGELEMAANYAIYTDECTVPGAALVGDACGCSHPLTATGMTVALHDVRQLSRAFDGVNVYDPRAVDRALAQYQSARYRYVRARELLADALYEVFRGVDDGARAIQDGIFKYWNASSESRARSMALLSGHESRLPAFLREYLTVVGMSTRSVLRGHVNEPTIGGRVRSLVGLGRKSVEKLGLVARGVREGSFGL